MDNRKEWVDYAKGIGIVLVVYGHVVRGLFNSGVEMDKELYLLIDSLIYSFHMPLFFFLSGLFLFSSLENKTGTKVLVKKVDTILYPYILWSLFQGSIEVALSKYTNGDVRINEVLSLFTHARAHFWFLYALFLIFFVTLIYHKLFNLNASIKTYFFLGVCLYFYPVYLISNVNQDYVFYNLPFFALGAIYFKFYNSNNFGKLVFLIPVAALFFSLQYFYHIILGESFSQKSLLLLLLSIISIFFIVSLSQFLSRWKFKFIMFLGASSLYIYLMHVLFSSGVRILTRKYFGYEYYEIQLIIGVFLGLALPLVFIHYANKLRIKYLFEAPISKLFNV